ncbi:MAG: hypothetical protein ACD_3C00135G0004 [uncultured bacterium (gcode 4)]|uniref:Tryptophan synthase beta chain-like PALP domain-containing protein n=1 Tax=uncultured bacterium (gcode 4) TaxID=1234023 RepID=K2F9T8_9BACT|nr:MAG: hypothetical protein ACD_3C00135G0004 [uncultured bacterium (gcode 4)]
MTFDVEYLDKINKEIILAHDVVGRICIKTNLKRLDWLKKLAWVDVFWKFESDQLTGSFKIRWAYYKLDKIKWNWKPVIAASAWNHWLAIAEAWKLLWIDTSICIPINASTIKKERLSYYDHSIIQYWDSLEEATDFARKIAKEKNLEFISPFNDMDLICWQGTLAIDILNQIDDINTIIIPVWWGWLIAWMAVYIKTNYPNIKIIWVEPENYSSVNSSIKNSEITRVTNIPTFADWLSVNLEEDSLTFDIIKNLVDEIIEVSEEEIAAATLSILYHESKLVEPSWAISISPILSWKIWTEYWKIAVVFSWWNISTSNVVKIANYPFKNKDLAKFTNYIYPTVDNEIKIKWVNNCSPEESDGLISDLEYDINFISSRFSDIKNKTANFKKKLKEYIDYCTKKWFFLDQSSLDKACAIIHMLDEWLLKNEDIELDVYDVPKYNRKITSYLQEYRSFLHLIMVIEMIFDYRSASYDQSLDSMFFSLESQDSPNVNYNRYESKYTSNLELQLSEILWINNEKNSVTVASSWMAAFNLIENYLVKYVLSPWDTLLVPNYIYFESEEQIKRLYWINFVKWDTYSTNEIISMILSHRPKVVFLDPMTNTLELNMIDIQKIIEQISNKTDYKIHFVVDWTMVSWAINPFNFNIGDNAEIFYYESCSKYLQLWLDMSMWWLVVTNVNHKNHFNRLRRNAWWIMYDGSVHMFPYFTRNEHIIRMKRFTRNWLFITNLINWDDRLKWKVNAIFPLETTHEFHEIAKNYDFIWWVLTFKFNNIFLNQRDILNACIDRIIKKSTENWVSITKWVSFWFSLPRISAAAAMNELDPPFLRLSVWDRSLTETELLAKVIIESFIEHILANELS